MPTPAYISFSNAFIPEATGQAIAYVRDKSQFKLNEYVQLVNAPEPQVAYAVLDPDQPVRVVTDQEFAWPDGQPRPRPQNNTGNFVWNLVTVNRRNYGYMVGEQALSTAKGWNPKAFFNAQILNQAMTNVTQRFITLAETVANWGSNTADANTLNGGAGTWDKGSNDPASPNFLAIKKSTLTALKAVVLATNGMVKQNDLILVISPGLAEAAANTSEIHSYLEKQERAIKVLEGEEPNINASWGLPSKLYGFKLVIEDAVRVTERPNAAGTPASTNRVFVKSDKSAVICSRPGGLDGNYGSPSFSTFQRYFWKYEMAVESFQEAKDKLYECHVVDQFVEVLAAQRAGFLITNCL